MPPDDERTGEHASALAENNGWDNGSLNGWNNAWANGSLNGWNNSWINGWANGSLNGYTNGSLNGWTNSWGQGWVNGSAPSAAVVGDGSKSIKRVRIEQSRVMADACITPPAGTQCPVDPNANGECCRRALLLSGVYFADLSHTYQGRWMTWYSQYKVSDSSRNSGVVNTTVVLDPCYTQGGVQVCDSPMSHLWQLAGPGAPMYPDCGSGFGVACNYGSDLIDTGIKTTTTVRSLFLMALSSLITTNGHYYIDIRWGVAGDNSTVLVPDPTFDTAPMEARWNYSATSYYDKTLKATISERYAWPQCYMQGAPQRAACDASNPGCVANLVYSVPFCSPMDTNPGPVITLW